MKNTEKHTSESNIQVVLDSIKSGRALHEQIRALFPLVPLRKGWRGPEFAVSGRRQYRGKYQYIAGYSHSRMYAHHFSGLCYERILGWGETQQAAIDMMKAKLEGGDA